MQNNEENILKELLRVKKCQLNFPLDGSLFAMENFWNDIVSSKFSSVKQTKSSSCE